MRSYNFVSFKNWCIKNNKQIYLDYWDYKSNELDPSDVPSRSKEKFYFKCPNPDHPHFLKSPSVIPNLRTDVFCPYCNSFGQYVINTQGKEQLEKIWSDKNTISYYEVSKNTSKKIWLKCQENEEHPDYQVPPRTYYQGCRCPYCSGKKPSVDNNLENSIPEIVNIWSDKNEKKPNEYTPHSQQKVWLKCSEGKHEDFQRGVDHISIYGYRCSKCMAEESSIRQLDDLTGRQFGRLTVLGIDPLDDKRNGIRYICQCSCEEHTIKSILGIHLRSGKVQSCGCYWHEQITGENNHSWKGGISSENAMARSNKDYKEWHAEVLKRDHYTCQCCGSDKNLQAHHLLNFSDYVELRYDTRNGITLCTDCHDHRIKGSFHNIYGTCNNTPEQLENYINTKRKELNIEEPFNLNEYIQNSEENLNMKYDRKCIMCGSTYRYCPHCTAFNNLPRWKSMFDEEVCRDVFNIITGYRTGSILPEDAYSKISELDLSGITFLDNVQTTIDEIMGIKPVTASALSESGTENQEDNESIELKKIEYKPRKSRKKKEENADSEEKTEETVKETEEENKAEETTESGENE